MKIDFSGATITFELTEQERKMSFVVDDFFKAKEKYLKRISKLIDDEVYNVFTKYHEIKDIVEKDN